GERASGARLSGASGGLSPLAPGFTDQVTACRCSFTTKRSTILWPCTESLSSFGLHGPKGGCCKWRDRQGPLPAKRASELRAPLALILSVGTLTPSSPCLIPRRPCPP